MRHVLYHDEELVRTIIEGAIEERKLPGKPRNLYVFQLKKDVGIDTYAGLKRLTDNRQK